MKATKKIVGATAALVAAIALSAGSTFAWFATSSQVSITGMSVNVAVENNLLIADVDDDGSFKGSIDVSSLSNTSMVPVSTVGSVDDAAPEFFKVSDAAGIVQDNSDFTKDTIFEKISNVTTEYYSDDFYLKYIGESESVTASNHDIVATINTTGHSTGITASLRVMIDVVSNESHTTFIYAPNNSDAEYSGIKSLGSDGKISDAEKATCLQEVTLSTNGSTAVISNINYNSSYHIKVYIWYEGQDGSCTTTNGYIATENTTVSITFEAK